MALVRKSRLSSLDVEKTFKKGKTVNSELFLIKFIPNQLKLSRFGVIVSSRVSKKAAMRNKIRRRVSEIIRLNISKIKPGYNVIFLIKPNILSITPKDLKKILLKELTRLSFAKQNFGG